MSKKVLNFAICLIATFMGSISLSFGQFNQTTEGPSRQAKIEEANMVKDRILLVVLTSNPDFDKKIKEVVNKFWTLSKKIEFVSNDNLKKMVKGNEVNYCVLSINEIEITEYSNSNGPTFNNKYIRFSVKLGEKLDSKKALFYQNIAYSDDNREFKKVGVFHRDKSNHPFDLEKKEILFALDFIQNHLIARIEGKSRLTFAWEAIENSGILATKTLLIAKEDIDEKITEQDIQQYYPYKYKITDLKEIESIYLSRSKDYAFVEIAPLGDSRGVNVHYIVDCENGKILSFGEEFNGAFDRFSSWVNKDHLKAYVKNSNRGKKK